MNSLIIHNDKSPFLEKFEYQIKFSSTNDIDRYITNTIIPKIKKSSIDKIYIKDSLSSNYLELLGLRVAYHIRLSVDLKERYLPIIILSDTTPYILNKITPLAQILFTKNIFIIQNTIKAIEKFSTKALKPLTEEEYKTLFLDRIKISSPKESSHDIANEWAIYKWSELVKAQSQAIENNNNKITSMLYFKYLIAKNPIEKSKAIGYKKAKLNGKVLYIDDEWDKGWSDIFSKYFASTLAFETFEYNFKDANIYTLMSHVKNKIETFKPDLVILDLRLIQNDHLFKNRTDIENFSGIKLTKSIKDINAGIQIISFTATSQSLILEQLYKHKILGYIKKEHPQDSTIKTKDSFEKLANLVDKGLEKKYLKEVWEIQKSILDLNLSNNINIEIKSLFEILDSQIENRYIYSMFAIFKVLEIIIANFTEEKYIHGQRDAYWKDTNNILKATYTNKNDTSENKIRCILDEKLNLKDAITHQHISNITYSTTTRRKDAKIREK
ncbi:MAG: Unknown protein [uncultured Sulfurovum sp.]|uniref:Inactive Receiver domain-containing protein n=1 Tax=uncultured Sulfurovum sp. TaxID=269237 RepID=A0A6S6SHC0_9BACT|nr:MAG: Unknown protein [uncultured Sulfurovum sp.]